jgi:hypothetical protein
VPTGRYIDKKDIRRLRDPRDLANVARAEVTHATRGFVTQVLQMVFHNHSAAQRVVSVHLVPSVAGVAGVAANDNLLFVLTIPINGTMTLTEEDFGSMGLVLSEVNDQVQAFADAAASVSVSAAGIYQ